MNKVFLIGNLTRDPETRTTNSGITTCSFTLAVNRRFANQQGVREADYINIVAWRQLADLCGRYLAKGRKCAVIGSIQTRTYDAQDGSKRYVTEIIADEVQFLSSSQGHATSQPSAQSSGSYGAADDLVDRARETFGAMAVEVVDDELPF